MNVTKLFMRLMARAGIFGMYIDDPAGGGGAPPPPPPSPRPPEPQTFSAEYVRELREENKGWRLKASEQENAAKIHKEAADKAAKEAEEKVSAATKASNDRIIRAELKAAALKAGMVDLDGLKLADLSKVTLDDKGEVQGADALMDELKKSKPYLFGAASTSTGKQPPPADPQKKKSAKDMTPEEYAAAEAEFLKANT
ncbi:MAG: hypothetical protein SHS37scaffold220_43 [Phage 67_12]|nr:MAG: hypothetical protein SHS37scaffold220_43 [Phage 67_12]